MSLTLLRSHLGASPASQVLSERPIDRHALAHDASHYLLIPELIARPKTPAMVGDLMRASIAAGLPLTLRGGGTSLSGQALTDGLLVDVRGGFQQITVLDEGRRVRVQPGATVRQVNARLARYRRRLGPDPASESACTIGGVVANNSSGMQCGIQTNTYRTLESLTFVLPSGTVIDSGQPGASQRFAEAEPELHEGLIRLRRRILDNTASVATIQRLFSIKNTMGYGLNSFLDFEDPLEIFVRLLIGSEGTLGFIAEATFRTVEILPSIATALLVFDDLFAASEAVPALARDAGVATAELLDAQSLLVAQADPTCPPAIQGLHLSAQAAVLIELQAGDADALQDLRLVADPVLAGLRGLTPTTFTSDPVERAALWHTRKGLYSTVAGARPSGTSALLEDVAVPVSSLGQMCAELVELFARHDYQGSVIFGHARDGNLHFMLGEDFNSAECLRRYEAFTDDMVDLVLGLDGTLKAEHGTGRIMAAFVQRQYGRELYEVMLEIKRLADPSGLLGSGSLLSEDPKAYLNDLKVAPSVETEVDRCVECGFCEPVCPSRALTLTPRQRIVLRRELAAAEAAGDQELVAALREDYEYEGVQTCAVDGMCGTVCPVHINTGDLVRRLRREQAPAPVDRAWQVAAGHWAPISRAGGFALSLADHVPASMPRLATTVGRKLVGTEQVPLYDEGLPGGGGTRAKADSAFPAAVFFAACIGTMFGGSDAAGALLRLAERAGVGLRTPEQLPGLCCGTPWKSKGLSRGYARMKTKVQHALDEATDGGRLPVVVDASSCTEGLHVLLAEHRLPDGSQLRVLDSVQFVAEFVLPHLPAATHPVDHVIIHPTCSSTQLGTTDGLVALARYACTAPDRVHVPIAWGCCAFAGDRGLLHPELTASATGPEAAEVAALTAAAGGRVAYVSTNRTCEIGMSRATGQRYEHILDLLDAVQ